MIATQRNNGVRLRFNREQLAILIDCVKDYDGYFSSAVCQKEQKNYLYYRLISAYNKIKVKL